MMNEAISTIMTKNPIVLSPSDSLMRVKEIFTKHRIHHIPIVKNGDLQGIITTYDLWKLNSNHDTYNSTTVSEVMTKSVAVVNQEDKVGTAAELFLDNRFHALPVVDQKNKLVGIVTSFDVLKYNFLKEYPNPILYKEVFSSAGPLMAVA